MKRSELIPSKAYYYSRTNDWSESYRNYPNLCQTAIAKKDYKVTIIRTYLETDYEKKYRQREVLVRDWRGAEKWIPLSHIRGTFKECVTSIYHRNRITDDRGIRYRKHLERKHDREQYKPALKQMLETVAELTGKSVWSYDRIESGFTLEQIQTINEALSLLKAQEVKA